MNLTALNSIEIFGGKIIELVQDISSYFHRSYKRTNTLKEIEELNEINYLCVKGFIKIRWFSLLGAVSRIISIYDALKKSIEEIEKSDKSEKGSKILKRLSDPEMILSLLIINKFLKLLNDLNSEFMHEKPRIHRVWHESIKKFRTLLSYICTADIIEKWHDDLLPNLDFENKKNFIKDEETLDRIINEINFEPYNIKIDQINQSYKKTVQDFINKIGVELKKNLNLENKTLIALKGIHPSFRRNVWDIKLLLNKFKNCYDEDETDLILEQIPYYKSCSDEELPLVSGDTNIDEYWGLLAYPPPEMHKLLKLLVKFVI